jgi:menaquinone-specific isochorismate synthase
LPQFEIFQRNNECFLSINLAINSKVNVHLLIDKIKQQIKNLRWSKRKTIEQSEKLTINNLKSISLETVHDFRSAVISALKSIHNHQFSKLVLAHALDVIAPLNFNIIDSLSYLRKCYPDCCIFSISNGEAKHFIGASPERLISIQERQLVTDALAGSYPRGKTLQQDKKFANKLLTSEKERREHQAVIDFLTQRLYQLGLNPQQSPIKLLQLSNIQHLWTPIYAKIPKHIHPLEIVAKLHPTPAVAGVPTEIACEQIRQYETFDRSLYASPLGWLDAQGNSEFIVGIRSALIEGNKARLYAGAGIVAGSDPDKELAEIQLKFQALLKSLVVNS